MNFPIEINECVKLEYAKDIGTVAVVVDGTAFSLPRLLLLDLTEIQYKGVVNDAKRCYVGRHIVNYLRDIESQKKLKNDYWMNEYLEKNEIIRIIDVVTKNAKIFIELCRSHTTMKQGVLSFNNENGRYGLLFQGDWIDEGFSCGDCFEVMIDGEWVSTRIEMNFNDEWYLAGTTYCGNALQNLVARI